MIVYLAHGKHHQHDGKWIQYQIEGWGHTVYNPFDGSDHAKQLTKAWEKAAEKNDLEKMRQLCKPIFEKDNAAIKKCDVVVAYYPDPSPGTSMEISIAKLVYYKRVIVMTNMIHPFVETLANYVLPENDNGLEQLQELLERLERK